MIPGDRSSVPGDDLGAPGDELGAPGDSSKLLETAQCSRSILFGRTSKIATLFCKGPSELSRPESGPVSNQIA